MREKMKKKIIIAGICIVALCAVIVPKFTKQKQFAQAVALPVMDAQKAADWRYQADYQCHR